MQFRLQAVLSAVRVRILVLATHFLSIVCAASVHQLAPREWCAEVLSRNLVCFWNTHLFDLRNAYSAILGNLRFFLFVRFWSTVFFISLYSQLKTSSHVLPWSNSWAGFWDGCFIRSNHRTRIVKPLVLRCCLNADACSPHNRWDKMWCCEAEKVLTQWKSFKYWQSNLAPLPFPFVGADFPVASDHVTDLWMGRLPSGAPMPLGALEFAKKVLCRAGEPFSGHVPLQHYDR